MKIKLITIGKTDEAYLKEGINKYISRLKHYVDFETKELPDVKMGKKLNINLQKEVEKIDQAHQDFQLISEKHTII